MIKFDAKSFVVVNKISTGDYKDKSMEATLINNPDTQFLVEPMGNGRYRMSKGNIIRPTVSVVETKKVEKPEPVKKLKPVKKSAKKAKKKGKKQ